MHLFLMRHGDAGVYSVPDRSRELTVKGRHEIELVTQAILSEGYKINSVVSSTFTRAIQSAQIVTALCGEPGAFTQHDAFTPDTPTDAAMDQLEIVFTDGLLVTMHQPLIGRLVGMLAHGDSSHSYPLQTGACVCLEIDFVAAGCGEIKWIKDPSQCRELTA